jgi:indolepyruvate ferredoxin oxidoreductase, alpha subunit
VCGTNAHAAVLCPSFYRSDVVHNPTPRDKVTASVRKWWMKRASRDLEAHAARFEPEAAAA